MSDFIKVNFKNGEIHIVPKSSIRLLDLSISYADNYHVIDATAQIHYNETSGCYSIYHPHYERTSISKEEYDRICKELYIDNPGDEMRIKDLEYSNKCLRYERDEAQRKYLELIHQQKCRDAERARKELGVE